MSAMQAVLEELSAYIDLKSMHCICDDHHIPRRKSFDDTIRELCDGLDGDLDRLVSGKTVSFSRNEWNDFLETHLHLPRRKSYEGIVAELQTWAAGRETYGNTRTAAGSAFHSVETSGVAPVPVGAMLDNTYRVRRKLGEGGFGAAYEVESDRPRALCVAKFAGQGNLSSLLNECQKVRVLEHQNLCRIIGVESDARFGPFLLVQHGGRSLQDAFPEGLTLHRATAILIGAASGLDFLHAREVVHGDVNPGNVLVDEHGVVRVADFGLSSFLTTARASDGVSRVATTLRGQHAYFSAPEVLGNRPASARSDQASLAKVLLWLLAGGRRFFAEERVGLSSQTPSVRGAVERALHSNPGDRYPSCRAFIAAVHGA